MLFAPLLLAGTLGQAYPPPSRYDPPPCAAARVPGCREGYRMRRDVYGRPVYVYDPNLDPNAPRDPPQAQAAPYPPQVNPPPPPAAPYPPPAAYPPQAEPPPVESRGQFGLVWMPFGGTSLRDATQNTRWTNKYAGLVGVELRGESGGGRVRLSGEYGPAVRIYEVGLKYDFLDQTPFHPFLGVALGAASIDHHLGFSTDWRPQINGVVGVDLYLKRDFFLTAEVKVRGFGQLDADPVTVSRLGQVSALIGAGIYL
jgi:hypothetical protein